MAAARVVADWVGVDVPHVTRPKGQYLKSEPRLERTSWIYYIQIHGLIKIGRSKNLTGRMANYGLTLRDLLAIEPGDINVERKRLAQFEMSRARAREWFWPTPDVIEHINSLRRYAKLPDLQGTLAPLPSMEDLRLAPPPPRRRSPSRRI